MVSRARQPSPQPFAESLSREMRERARGGTGSAEVYLL